MVNLLGYLAVRLNGFDEKRRGLEYQDIAESQNRRNLENSRNKQRQGLGDLGSASSRLTSPFSDKISFLRRMLTCSCHIPVSLSIKQLKVSFLLYAAASPLYDTTYGLTGQ